MLFLAAKSRHKLRMGQVQVGGLRELAVLGHRRDPTRLILPTFRGHDN